MTLIELIVVVAIAAALLGISVAGYVSFGRGLKITGLRNRIETVVRQARNSTLYEGAPAGVFVSQGEEESVSLQLRNPSERLDGKLLVERDDKIVFQVEGRAGPVEFPPSRVVSISKTQYVRAVGFATVGQWHLEGSDLETGCFGRACRVDLGEAAAGRIGGGVRFAQKGKARGGITALAAPDDATDPFALPDGGRLEFWVNADRRALERESFLVRRAGSYELRLASGGILAAQVSAAHARAVSYRLPAGRWVKIALEFSPTYVRVYADDVPRAWTKGADLSPAKKQKLIFGEQFAGAIDEIRVQRRVESDSVEIPKHFEVKGPKALFFDARGRLDPSRHSAPVRYEVSRDGKSTGFTVALGGMIEAD
jgi:hypothetical protein